MLGLIKDKLDLWLRYEPFKDYAETDFDNPETTKAQRSIFHAKPILGYIYDEYCRGFVESARGLPEGARLVELGSGVGVLKEHVPGLLRTDIILDPELDTVCSAYALPFKDASLDRVFMQFVFHHLDDPSRMLAEVERCLKPGGELVMLEPAVTAFSRFYFRFLHPDGIDTETSRWGFEPGGRLSGANSALPWMVFIRDGAKFKRLFPKLEVARIEYNTCLTYLLSGGMRLRQLLPDAALRRLFEFENWIIRRFCKEIAVSMHVVVKKL